MKQRRMSVAAVAISAAVVAALGGCSDNDDATPPANTLPAGVTNVVGPNVYDGTTDDLLDGGPGQDWHRCRGARLRGRDQSHDRRVTQTRDLRELSRRDRPHLRRWVRPLLRPEHRPRRRRHAGRGQDRRAARYLAYVDDGTGRKNVTVMVQIPSNFDRNSPCIVTGPSSGSRGVYGAIGTAGDWGLKRRCAVAYTDAGKGIGYHDLMSDKVNLIDGRLVTRSSVAPNLVALRRRPWRSASRRTTRSSRTASPTSTSSRSRTRRKTGAGTSWTACASPSGRSTRPTAMWILRVSGCRHSMRPTPW